MDIRSVREIIQYGAMTTVPLMPDFVRGVINLRGAVVPVIDLHARFGRPAAQVGKKTCIVIFDAMREGERVELGLLVDAVSEVIDIAADADRAAAELRHLGAPRLHPRHGQGRRAASSSSSSPTGPSTSTRWPSLCEAAQDALAA